MTSKAESKLEWFIYLSHVDKILFLLVIFDVQISVLIVFILICTKKYECLSKYNENTENINQNK